MLKEKGWSRSRSSGDPFDDVDVVLELSFKRLRSGL